MRVYRKLKSFFQKHGAWFFIILAVVIFWMFCKAKGEVNCMKLYDSFFWFNICYALKWSVKLFLPLGLLFLLTGFYKVFLERESIVLKSIVYWFILFSIIFLANGAFLPWQVAQKIPIGIESNAETLLDVCFYPASLVVAAIAQGADTGTMIGGAALVGYVVASWLYPLYVLLFAVLVGFLAKKIVAAKPSYYRYFKIGMFLLFLSVISFILFA